KYSTDLDACSFSEMDDETTWGIGVINFDNFSGERILLLNRNVRIWLGPTRLIHVVNRIQQQQFLHVRILIQRRWIERRFLVAISRLGQLGNIESCRSLNRNDQILLLQLD